MVTTTTPKERGNNQGLREEGNATKEKVDQIVTFSKPPPVPPVFGPLVALSVFETWYSRDSNDD